VQRDLKITRLEISDAREMVRQSRATLERLIAEGQLPPVEPNMISGQDVPQRTKPQ